MENQTDIKPQNIIQHFFRRVGILATIIAVVDLFLKFIWRNDTSSGQLFGDNSDFKIFEINIVFIFLFFIFLIAEAIKLFANKSKKLAAINIVTLFIVIIVFLYIWKGRII